MESLQCLDVLNMKISKRRKRNNYITGISWNRKRLFMLSAAQSTKTTKSLQQSQFINGFQSYSYVMTVNGFLLVSWKLTSFPLYAFFSLLVMTRKAMICCRMKVSGLVMSTSTSGLLIWLVKPSFIISGKYLGSRMKD